MNKEKLLINNLKSNNSEIMSNKQIEEMREKIRTEISKAVEGGLVTWTEFADWLTEALYNEDYRKQEWISVDERLPTEQKDFLVYYGFDKGDGDLGMMFTGVLTYFAYDKKPHFQHEEIGLRVTHWMSLPEPPKGE